MNDRRAVLEAIAYGGDPKVTPGDRLKALEALREYDAPPSPSEEMDEDQIWAEIDSWHAMTLSAMFVASGVDLRLDPSRFPKTARALRDVVDREVAGELANRELRAEQLRQEREREQHRDGVDVVDADAVEVSDPADAEALPSGTARRQIGPPPGIDLARGWGR